ncbi:MAG TPA: hypothetical protein VGL77_11000 [Armatimonadota bacterium]
MTFMLATIVVMSAKAVATCHGQDVPTSICEHLDGDDLDDVRLESVPAYPSLAPQHPMPATQRALTVLHLSPVIFQPPETA